jgi:predicted RND superfamily exporter protein
VRDTAIALIPLTFGMGVMLGVMSLLDLHLNFMNIVVLPIVLGYGVSHGVYLMHRFREGVSPRVALLSVGAAVACSTLTSLAGWLALSAAAHRGLKSMGTTAGIGMAATLIVSFTVMMGLLQLLHDRRQRRASEAVGSPLEQT